MTDFLRAHAEQQFADELRRARGDRRPAAAAGLAPLAVGRRDLPARRQAADGTVITPEVHRRPAADRDRGRDAGHRPRAAAARRPGHREDVGQRAPRGGDHRRLDAARPGHGRAPARTRSATAGTTRGCSPRARRGRARRRARSCAGWPTGKIVRVEELTRIPSDVQDALITILSEKTLPIPELDDEVQARQGLQRHRDRERPRPRRERAVLARSSAASTRSCCRCRRRPRRRSEIVRERVEQLGRALELPAEPPALEEIRRIVTIFRELRCGQTEDGKHEAEVAVGDALDRRGDRGRQPGPARWRPTSATARCSAARRGRRADRRRRPDPVQDRVVWREYLETVVKERDGWRDLYRACREAGLSRVTVSVLGIRHHGPGSARAVAHELERLEPDIVLIEGPARRGRADPAGRGPGDASRRWRCSSMRPTSRGAPRSTRSPRSPRSGRRCASRSARSPVRFIDLPRGARWLAPTRTGRRRARRIEGRAATRSARSPRPPATTTGSAGGRTCRVAAERRGRSRRRRGDGRRARPRCPTTDPETLPRGHDAPGRSARREREGHGRIAVVCGAWHAPALADMPPAARDAALLKGLPKPEDRGAWVPWTYERLARSQRVRRGHPLAGLVRAPVARRPSRRRRPWMARVAQSAARGGPRRVAPPT